MHYEAEPRNEPKCELVVYKMPAKDGKAKPYQVKQWREIILKYEIIIYWSERDGSFIAEVPELPGCMADGKTYQEALHNAQIIIQEWLETATMLGRPIPEPKGRLMYA